MSSNCEDNELITKRLNECLDKHDLVRQFRTGTLDVDGVLKRIAEEVEGGELLQVHECGGSLLHTFSLLGYYEIVEKLWERGLRPSKLKDKKCTLLHCACRTYPPDGANTRDLARSKILRLFLTAGKEYCNSLPIDQRNYCGWTALKSAVKLNLAKCVEVLLEHGADTRLTDEESYSPLHNAVGNHSIVKMLLNADPGIVDTQNADGNTALFLSLKKGDLESCMVLLDHNADTNIPNKEGN